MTPSLLFLLLLAQAQGLDEPPEAAPTIASTEERWHYRVLSAGVRERPWRHPVPSSALLIGLGETRWRDEL